MYWSKTRRLGAYDDAFTAQCLNYLTITAHSNLPVIEFWQES